MITKACVEDIDDVLKIENVLFRSPWTKALFEAELKKETSVFYVLKIEKSLAGYIVAYNLGVEAEIADIAVHPSFQGCGYGVQLLEAVLEKLNEGVDVFLEVAIDNTVAIGLYEKVGFKNVGIRRDYYGIGNDAMVMKLIISRGG